VTRFHFSVNTNSTADNGLQLIEVFATSGAFALLIFRIVSCLRCVKEGVSETRWLCLFVLLTLPPDRSTNRPFVLHVKLRILYGSVAGTVSDTPPERRGHTKVQWYSSVARQGGAASA